MKSLKDKFNEQTPTMKGFILIIILLIIGIILRWDSIIEEAADGFRFFSKK